MTLSNRLLDPRLDRRLGQRLGQPLGALVLAAATAMVFPGCDADGNSVSATATADGSSSGSGGTSEDPATGGPGATSATPGTSGEPGTGTGGFPPAPGQCEQTPTVVGLDDDNVTNNTAQEIIDRVSGAFTGAMVWTTEGPAPYNGSAGPIDVQIDLSYEGGEIRSVEGALLEPCDHDGPCPCPSLLEIDAVFRIASTDGVLDEAFAVTIQHGEGNGFDSGRITQISFPFEPNDTAGTLSRDAFDLNGDASINEMVLLASLDDGAISGGLNLEVEMLGGVGFGTAASFGAVREPEACTLLHGGACTLASCVEVQGRPIYGSAPNACECDGPVPYCFAEELVGDDAVTRYTREFDDGYEVFDEVVEFGVSTELGGSWRACADAPEVVLCGCEGTC